MSADTEVLRAVERDLRREYGNRFRVLRANSGESALDALRQLKLRNDPVALLLVDQRMPRMSGVEFIERANTIYPEAKRALLTAYADIEAAIGAINKAGTRKLPLAVFPDAEQLEAPDASQMARKIGLRTRKDFVERVLQGEFMATQNQHRYQRKGQDTVPSKSCRRCAKLRARLF